MLKCKNKFRRDSEKINSDNVIRCEENKAHYKEMRLFSAGKWYEGFRAVKFVRKSTKFAWIEKFRHFGGVFVISLSRRRRAMDFFSI